VPGNLTTSQSESARRARTILDFSRLKSLSLAPRILFFGFSFVATLLCACAAAAHYRKAAWGDLWQPVGWLLGMFFLLLAFFPSPRKLATGLKALIKPKAGFFLFWILFFIVSHLWNFRTAPWNGNALFDESGWDLWYLKSYVIGHPYQPAWFHGVISRETLFHYYVWGFLELFGFNILSYEAALFVIWLTIFLFTLLLVDLLFDSYVVTSVTALIVNFLPFAFMYTFAGYRYPMATALAVVSLYFLHLGFRSHLMNAEHSSHSAVRRSGNPTQTERDAPQGRGYNASEIARTIRSRFFLSLGGIAAGLCLASSISGKQYLLALAIAAPIYAWVHRKSLMRNVTWTSLAIMLYSFLAGATPILLYIAFNSHNYTYYESSFLRDFWHAARTAPFPSGIRPYIDQCRSCFFRVPALRFFIPDTLPIPLPYYWLLVPGFGLAVWQKRFEIPLLALIPIVGAFIAKCIENRLLLPIPFWVILISFTIAAVLKMRQPAGLRIVLGVLTALVLLSGLVPSIRYIYSKTKDPFSIHYYAQYEVAVSRFLRHVVAGQEHPGPPHLERNEFNRIKGIPDAPYDTFICQNDAYSIIHLFLHDYDDARTLSFCSGLPFFWVMSEQDVWNANKRAILSYVPSKKDLKLIWERDPKTNRIISEFQSLRDLGSEDSLLLSFGERTRRFYVLNIPNNNIRQFQDRVRTLPAKPGMPAPRSNYLPDQSTTMFKSGKGTGNGQFDSPLGIAVDSHGNVLVADTGNNRLEKFSPTGRFLSIIGSEEDGHGQLSEPNGIAVDQADNIYVAEVGNHCVKKLAADGTFLAEWKGPTPGFYGPRRIAIGPDHSIYVVDQGRARIVKFSPNGEVLTTWGTSGTGDGQFNDHTSVAVNLKNNKVYVADPINKRIQVFDSNGKFLIKWLVPEWGQPHGFEDLAIDSQAGRLYASSANLDGVLVFDLNGTRIGTETPKAPDKLEAPSALALLNRKLYVLNMASNHVSVIDL
jgi:DNA-binding beta-propeller fold protein YncE